MKMGHGDKGRVMIFASPCFICKYIDEMETHIIIKEI